MLARKIKVWIIIRIYGMSNSAMTLTYTANKSIRTHEGKKKSICGFVSASTPLFGYKIKLKRVPYRWLSCDMKRYSTNQNSQN